MARPIPFEHFFTRIQKAEHYPARIAVESQDVDGVFKNMLAVVL